MPIKSYKIAKFLNLFRKENSTRNFLVENNKATFLKHFIFILCFSPFLLVASSADDYFKKAGEAYSKGEYKEAIDHYEKIGQIYLIESAQIYCNIGNAYFKLTDYPSAILNYEKAIKLDPTFEDAKYNLNVSNLKITDKIEPLPDLFYTKWWKTTINLLKPNQWAILFLSLLFMGTAFFSFYILSKKMSWRRTGFYIGVVLFSLATLVFVLGNKSYNNANRDSFAIVFVSRLPVKSSPSAMGTDLFFIHAGTKVETIDQVGEWLKIKIADGNQGWVEADNLAKI